MWTVNVCTSRERAGKPSSKFRIKLGEVRGGGGAAVGALRGRESTGNISGAPGN